jgi:hypothetical protein
MKLLVLLLFSFINISANSQKLGKISDLKIFKDSVLIPGNLALANFPKYKFLFDTKKGKVFESPTDKMRCLVAGFHSNMPVAGINKIKPEPMPNASRLDLIPQNKK